MVFHADKSDGPVYDGVGAKVDLVIAELTSSLILLYVGTIIRLL